MQGVFRGSAGLSPVNDTPGNFGPKIGARNELGEIFQMERRASHHCAGVGCSPVQQLPTIHQALKSRLIQRRCVVFAVLDDAAIPLAAQVSAAPEDALLAFIKALYEGRASTKRILELGRALDASPFEVATSLRVALSEHQRSLLSIQVHALEALCKALSRVDARMAQHRY